MTIEAKFKDAVNKATQPELVLFNNRLRRYWAANIGKYFTKSENYSRVYIADAHNTSKIRDALVVSWSPKDNHVLVTTRTVRISSRPQDLLVILKTGTRSSPGRYVAALNRRVDNGTHPGISNSPWLKWLEDFIRVVDSEVNDLGRRVVKNVDIVPVFEGEF